MKTLGYSAFETGTGSKMTWSMKVVVLVVVTSRFMAFHTKHVTQCHFVMKQVGWSMTHLACLLLESLYRTGLLKVIPSRPDKISDQTRPDQTRLDETRPNQSRSDQTR